MVFNSEKTYQEEILNFTCQLMVVGANSLLTGIPSFGWNTLKRPSYISSQADPFYKKKRSIGKGFGIQGKRLIG